MDQSQDMRRIESSKACKSPTFEQLMHVSDSMTPGKGGSSHGHKKSVLSKVKEKARKIKRSLSKKKHGQHDEEEGSQECRGGLPTSNKAQMAPEPEIASEKHVLATEDKHEEVGLIPDQEITKPSSELSPSEEVDSVNGDTFDMANDKFSSSASPASSTEKGMFSANSWKQTWGRSISMKDYFMQKLEPGEDEKALSNVITEAMTPMKTIRGDGGGGRETALAEKVTEQQQPQMQEEKVAFSFPASPIPISTNAHEYYNEEETQGRTLKTN